MDNQQNETPRETKKCPKCQEEISSKAQKCPKCQTDLRPWPAKHPILSILLILILLCIVCSILFGESKEDKIAARNIHDAAQNCDVNSIKKLIKEGANVNALDDRNDTPIDKVFNLKSCPDSNKRIRTIATLVELGADINHKHKGLFGYTPLHKAVGLYLTQEVVALIDMGADYKAKNDSGQTPLDLAEQMSTLTAVPLDERHINNINLYYLREINEKGHRPRGVQFYLSK